MARKIQLLFLLLLNLVTIDYVLSESYIVGGDFDYPPFSYIDKTGKATGMDIDILKAISVETGIEFKFLLTEWDSALNHIQTGKTDIITGIIFSDNREGIFDFTYPLNTEFYSIFIRNNLPLKDVSDLYEYKPMVLEGDISIEKFLKPMGLYGNHIDTKSLPEAIAAIEWGRADYVIAPHSLGMNEIVKNSYENIEVKGPPIIPSIYCMAVKKGNTHLLGILNKGISDLRAKGKLKDIQARWKVYERDEFKYKRIIKSVAIILLIGTFVLVIVLGWIWILRKQIKRKTEDINQKNRELQKLNAEKDKFLSIIAHDLKSPFNAIIGYSDLLKIKIKNNNFEEIYEYAKVIGESSQRAMNLLSNLMQWSLSQTGGMKFNPEYFKIDEVIDCVVLLFSDLASQKSIQLSHKSKSGKLVFADKKMISTVLRNLISNAIKYTPLGNSIDVNLEVKQNKIVISVHDTGVGIDELTLQKLFRTVSNNSTPGTLNEQGTGLGLLICKEFIEKHKEEIHVESKPGKGSVFSFSLPLKDE